MSLLQNNTALLHHNVQPMPQVFGHKNKPFTSLNEIHTQDQKCIVIIKAVAIVIFACTTIATNTPLAAFCAIVVGAAFSGWTIYSNIIKSDPLMEAFINICGGEERFNNLPTIELSKKKRTFDALRKLSWDDLPAISRAKTPDGRTIVIVKALQQDSYSYHQGKEEKAAEGKTVITINPSTEFAHSNKQDIFAFVEKLGPNDFSREKSYIPESIYSIFSTLFWFFWPTSSHRGTAIDFVQPKPIFRKTLLDDVEDEENEVKDNNSPLLEESTTESKTRIVMTSFITAKMNHDFCQPINSLTINNVIKH